MRKPDFRLRKNKGADQLCSNCTADQRLSFRYTDRTIPPLLKPKISCMYHSSITVQAGLSQTWSETPKTGFLASRLICVQYLYGLLILPSVTYRLVNGSSPSIGRLEVAFDGEWGTVCSNGFDDREAKVVCRRLGFR